jgi:hypothetical protein
LRASNSNATQEYSRFKDDDLRGVYDRQDRVFSIKIAGHDGNVYRLDILWAMSTGCTQFLGHKKKKGMGDKAYGHARKI